MTLSLKPEKPFSPATERNREAIVEKLIELFSDVTRVLEIGSGSGQHALYFASKLPHLTWLTSDLPENCPGIKMWLEESPQKNVEKPLELDVRDSWQVLATDAIFTANTLHIMSEGTCACVFQKASGLLGPGQKLVVYGPFKYDGCFTSESNEKFEQWLKGRDPTSGIKNIEHLSEVASRLGLGMIEDHEMPAHNRLLVFQKT